MNRDTLNKIIQEIESILKFLHDGIRNEKISKIETDIILSKLRNAYEWLSENRSVANYETASKQQDETETFELEASEGHDVLNETPTNPEPVIHEEIINKPQKDIIQDEKPKEIVKSDITSNKFDQPREKTVETIAEKYQHTQTILHETLTHNRPKRDISQMMQSQPIKDIEAAIDVNERFLFIKELFNSDTTTYEKTIKILNTAQNFNDAFNYINQHFSWDIESEPAQRMLDLLRRRFINSE
jgi:ribosomal protein L14E/L6E/L27E